VLIADAVSLQKETAMQIQWRRHEIFLAGLIACSYILSVWVRDSGYPQHTLEMLYGEWFKHYKMPFNYIRNVGGPETLMAILLFTSHLLLNLMLIKRSLFHQNFVRLIPRLALLLLVLLAGAALVQYFEEQYLYHGNTGTRYPITYTFARGGKNIIYMLSVYVPYLLLRELIIDYLERNHGNRAFRIWCCNQFTAGAVAYFSVFFFAVLFKLFLDRLFVIAYCYVIPPLILGFYICLFAFSRHQGAQLFRKKREMLRYLTQMQLLVLGFTFAYTIIMNAGRHFVPFLIILTLIQLIVAPTMAWLVYNQQRNKIDMLQGLQAELGQTQASLQSLRAQINPHFLFNALNTIYGMALQEGAHQTAEGAQKLGEMMRFMLHENAQEKIPLQRELDYLRNYIHLQLLRTQVAPSIRIDIQLPETVPVAEVPPMLLIPFVENAFKHGISLEKPSFIRVTLTVHEGSLFLDVHNSIHQRSGEDTERMNNGIGLVNVQKRLELLYPDRHELIIRSGIHEYFIHLTIQLN